jgi:hypothetical protein
MPTYVPTYIAMHCIALHYITLHCITLHWWRTWQTLHTSHTLHTLQIGQCWQFCARAFDFLYVQILCVGSEYNSHCIHALLWIHMHMCAVWSGNCVFFACPTSKPLEAPEALKHHLPSFAKNGNAGCSSSHVLVPNLCISLYCYSWFDFRSGDAICRTPVSIFTSGYAAWIIPLMPLI